MLQCIAFETQACLVEQIRRHGQITLRRRQIDMSKIGGQFRQQIVQVGSAAIPRDETVDGCRVPKIMQAWLSPWTALTNNHPR